MHRDFQKTDVLGVGYAELNYTNATRTIIRWAKERTHRMVVVAPVSSLMMSRWNPDLSKAFKRADMITSDGVPIVWARRLMGRRGATRLYGPDLMLHVLRACEEREISVALLGGRPERLEGLTLEIKRRFPCLNVTYAWSPPFRSLSDSEIVGESRKIRNSGAQVVFVGVGCPKQELLMHRMAPMLPAVQLGVGAAFDFIPGYVKQAPRAMQQLGLEWAFRLWADPGRLWKRYATTIPPYVWHVGLQIARFNLHRGLRTTGGTA